MVRSTHHHLLLLQKRIFRSLKAEAELLLGATPATIRKYEKSYQKDFSHLPRHPRPLKKTELMRQIRRADVTFIADYHTFGQAQRTAIRIIRDVVSLRNRPLRNKNEEWLIGLELIPSQYQSALDDFQAGKLSLEEFHDLIRYREEWGFPWKNYAPIFELARNAGIRIIALNRPKALIQIVEKAELKERDRWAAGVITDLFHEKRMRQKKLKMIVLYGELHVATQHLPAELKKVSKAFMRKPPQVLTIHQNHDALYWRLAEEGRELHTEIVQLKKEVFCVFSSTPWAKLQSLVSFLEGELPHLEDHWEKGEKGEKGETDYLTLISTYGNTLAEFLHIKAPSYSGLTVQTIGEADFIESLRNHEFSREELHLIRFHVLNNQLLYIPRAEIAYLGSPSQNAAAELAAVHLLNSGTRNRVLFYRSSDDFYRLILESTFGFLGSLILNPRRKCDLPGDHLNRYQALTRGAKPAYPFEKEARQLTLATLNATTTHFPLLKNYLASRRFSPAIMIAARSVGQITAKRLHKALLAEGVSVDKIRTLFFSNKGPSAKRYAKLLKLVSPEPIAPSKTESL